MNCPICQHRSSLHVTIEEINYYNCSGCQSIFAHPDFLRRIESSSVLNYRDEYWADEIGSARERSYGTSIIRLAETLRIARVPVHRILDIGSGPGFLLDALDMIVPGIAGRTYGIELFPPPPEKRSTHRNYKIGQIADLPEKFDAGVCIEVIEHLTPGILRNILRQLADRSNQGAIYFFNSAQPSFVHSVDPGYLDPHRRGHIVSWSIAGVRTIFEPAGFNVIPLPGRDWAFLAEYGPVRLVGTDTLMEWLWRPLPENLALTNNDPYGPLFGAIGLESARCYLEAATVEARTQWAVALKSELEKTNKIRHNKDDR